MKAFLNGDSSPTASWPLKADFLLHLRPFYLLKQNGRNYPELTTDMGLHLTKKNQWVGAALPKFNSPQMAIITQSSAVAAAGFFENLSQPDTLGR